MRAVLDRIEADFAALRVWADEGKPLPFIDEGHDFVVSESLSEAELLAIEHQYQVSLPPEYRAFLGRFGDTTIGPGNHFRCVREGLTTGSKEPFPLVRPFLGTLSPAHQQLLDKRQWEAYKDLLDECKLIPTDNGVLWISDYGCSMYGVLVLNGPYRGQIWFLSADAAYYGPFGVAESLHDESVGASWTPTETPREYSFFEWYENWLAVKLKSAGLLEW